ncbi:hypothetical protein [Streptomyces sp. NRRL B-24720]|uniref:hypothetical protein n=1 Tax=Streptomyces sp. NRRL B-24720 TaxID=1476876 RepID=UPI0004C7FA75|nr:hypothetical protein [Streptomyces sp. NRRL B-24720]
MAPSDLDRLAKAARKRRNDLGLALNDKNAKAAKTSKGTWQRVERGETIRPTNYVKIDALLQWAPGSCMAVLGGGEPIPTKASEDAPGVQISQRPAADLEGRARDVIRLAMIATETGLTVEQVRELSDRAVQDLKANGLI